MIKKRAVLLGVVCLLAGCTATPPVISVRELDVDEQNMVQNLGFRDGEDAFFWSYRAPQGAQRMTFWMEYYQNGELMDFETDRPRAQFRTQEGETGTITLALRSVQNQLHTHEMGKNDFFNMMRKTEWLLNVESKRGQLGSGYTTGYDLVEPHDGSTQPSYRVRYGYAFADLPAVLDEEQTLVSFCLSTDIAGNDLDVLEAQSNPDFYKAYPYAYALKCKFESQE